MSAIIIIRVVMSLSLCESWMQHKFWSLLIPTPPLSVLLGHPHDRRPNLCWVCSLCSVGLFGDELKYLLCSAVANVAILTHRLYSGAYGTLKAQDRSRASSAAIVVGPARGARCWDACMPTDLRPINEWGAPTRSNELNWIQPSGISFQVLWTSLEHL